MSSLVIIALLVMGVAGPARAAGKTIGVVFSGDLPRYKEAQDAFEGVLEKAGLDKSRVDIYVQTPNPDAMSWSNSVRKFVSVGADVIVTYGAPASLAAAREAGGIPVVFAYVYDPESCGLKVPPMSGASSKVPVITLLKTLKSITPVTRLAVVYNPDEKDSVVQLDDLKKNAPSVGIQVVEVKVKTPAEVKGRLSGVTKDVDSVYVSCSAAVGKAVKDILAVAAGKKLPVITQDAGLAEKGALLSLAPSSAEQGEMAALKAVEILKGGKASGVESSRRVDLVLNLKTANELGLKVPFEVLNAATKVVK